MVNPPIVSVVIPVFNRLEFLTEAIASIERQTLKRHETIVVDDGSEVDIRAVVGGLRKTRLLRKANGGLGSARNYGAAHAEGQYLLFLDDDDVLEPQALEVLLETARAGQPEAAWAAGRFRYMDRDGTELDRRHRGHFASGDAYLDMIEGNQFGAPCVALISREAFQAVGGFETDPQYRGCEDYDLWLSLARGWPLAASVSVVARYRLHANSMSTDWTMIYESQLNVLRKHRARARAGTDRAFALALTHCHLSYGDDLYMAGRDQEARTQWRSGMRGPGVSPAALGVRFAKSVLPHNVRKAARRLRARLWEGIG